MAVFSTETHSPVSHSRIFGAMVNAVAAPMTVENKGISY